MLGRVILKTGSGYKEVKKEGEIEGLKEWIGKMSRGAGFVEGEVEDGSFACCDGERYGEYLSRAEPKGLRGI